MVVQLTVESGSLNMTKIKNRTGGFTDYWRRWTRMATLLLVSCFCLRSHFLFLLGNFFVKFRIFFLEIFFFPGYMLPMVSSRSVGGASRPWTLLIIFLNATQRFGGHRTSQRAQPTDLQLTHYQQCVPQKEGKKVKKLWKNLGHGKTTDRPPSKTFCQNHQTRRINCRIGCCFT